MSDDTGRDWFSDTPPKDTWVWARYSCSEPWRLVKTCRNGCCVYSAHGCMTLPYFWKAATREEGELEAAEWADIQPIDRWDLL